MSRGIDFEPAGGTGSGSDDQTAAEVPVTPFSTIAATDVQAALEEIVSESYTDEQAQDAVGGILVDTTTVAFVYSDATPSITASVPGDSISNAKLSNMAEATIKGRAAGAGTGDPTDLTAAQVKTILDFDEAAQDAVGGIVQSSTTITAVYTDAGPSIVLHVTPGSLGTGALSFDPATQTELDAHTGDTSDAHDASAISVVPFGSIAATDVQAALEEIVSEGGGGYSDEQAQDAVGGIMQSSTTIAVVYTDATPTIIHHILPLALTTGLYAADSVTYPKIQNVSTNSIVLGRFTIGTGDIEELTGANVWTLLASTLGGVAQGDVIIATSGTAFDNLAPGTAAGKALVADPNATNKISFNYPMDLIRATGASTAGTALVCMGDRTMAVLANTSVLTSGQLIGVNVQLPKGLTITSISFTSATTALVTGTNQWFGLADSTGAILRLTGDDTSTAWAANTKKTLNLSSTFTTTYAGLHYVLIMVAASTVPTLSTVGSGFAGDITRTGGAGVFMSARDGTHTGLTNPASCPDPWTPTNSVGPPWYELL
jgi:hypothetical protein